MPLENGVTLLRDGRYEWGMTVQPMKAEGHLHRPTNERVLAGVCGGIAKNMGWDPTWVRVGYVVGSTLSAAFPGILVYLLLWVLMPPEE